MNGERPESAIRHGNPRALSLGGQSILLGAALLIGTSVVGWMALNAMGSAAIWRNAGVVSTALAVLVLSMALAWRLVAQCREFDELVLLLERRHGRPEPSLDERAAEMRRVAVPQLGSPELRPAARKTEKIIAQAAASGDRPARVRGELATAIQETALDSIISTTPAARSSHSTRQPRLPWLPSGGGNGRPRRLIAEDRASLRRGLRIIWNTGEALIIGSSVEYQPRCQRQEFPVSGIVANSCGRPTATIRD
jgi:hypothetical protein